MNRENKNRLFKLEKEKTSGETIYKRSINRFHIDSNTTIGELAEIFITRKNLDVITVTDENLIPLGIIDRQELLCLVGQKFGRELHNNKPVSDFVMKADTIYYKKNIFSVIDEVREFIENDEIRFLVLIDQEDKFRALTSTRELTKYFSLMMTRDIAAARDVQKAIVKSDITLSGEKLQFCGSSKMAGGIGGDFHCMKKIDEDRWIMSICDVSGKGMKAALISVSIGGMFHSFNFDSGLDTFICSMNSYIHELFHGEIFVTGIFAEFNEKKGEMAVYDMGHSLIYLQRDRKIFRVKTSENNFPLGIQREIIPERSVHSLNSGDIIISATDGITEQTDMRNEFFGEKNFLSAILNSRTDNLEKIRENVFSRLREFKFGQTQVDDMTLVLVKYSEEISSSNQQQ